MDPHTGYFPESYVPPNSSNARTRQRKQHMTNGGYDSDSNASTASASSSLVSSSSSSASSTMTSSSYDSELLELQAAEREWEENVRQLQLAVTVLILPTIGKWLGRRWCYSLYARYIKVGWTWALFLPESWILRTST